MLTSNAAVQFVLLAGGFALYLLLREMGAVWLSSLVAAAAFAVVPYRLGEVVHPHVIGTHLAAGFDTEACRTMAR